jgi:thymidylate synthase
MRSNDVWAGYRNDLAWQKYVLEELGSELGVETGSIIWNVGSLHLYEKDFWRVDCYVRYGHENLTKAQYLDRLSKA